MSLHATWTPIRARSQEFFRANVRVERDPIVIARTRPQRLRSLRRNTMLLEDLGYLSKLGHWTEQVSTAARRAANFLLDMTGESDWTQDAIWQKNFPLHAFRRLESSHVWIILIHKKVC